MILVGELSLWVALLMAAWTFIVSVAGAAQKRADLVRSGERAVYATFGFTLLASLGIWTALFQHDFSFRLVASYTSANLPTLYNFSAFWSGSAGSLLFCTLILSLCSAITVFANRRTHRALLPWATGTLGLIALFFLMALAFGFNPYERLDLSLPDGRGMDPQLQNAAMALHLPVLYVGLVVTAVPFAFAVAGLIARELGGDWIVLVRRWMSLSWFCVTIAIVLGMWWAYAQAGLGDDWPRHAVQDASILPWLTSTVFLHSIIVQERRGTLRKWNIVLVMCTFILSIASVFLTRRSTDSDVLARSPVGTAMGSAFVDAAIPPLGLLLLASIAGWAILSWHRDSNASIGRQLALPVLAGVVIAALLVVNGLRDTYALILYPLAGFAFGIIIVEFVQGLAVQKRMYSEGPARTSSGAIERDRRRYGGYILHVGVVVLCCAFAGLKFSKDVNARVKTGETVSAIDPYGHTWSFTSQGISRFEVLNRHVLSAAFNVSRDGKRMGIMASERRQYVNSLDESMFEPYSHAAIVGSPAQDVYLMFSGGDDLDSADVHIRFNPLVWWVWFGGVVMAVGGLMVMWPRALHDTKSKVTQEESVRLVPAPRVEPR